MGDTQYEPDEQFNVDLTNPVNASLNNSTTVGTITNDDAVPTLVINNVSHSEGNSGTTAYVFSVSLSNPSSQSMTVTYTTVDGTATTADSDYVAASGTLTFAAGDTSAQLITVLVNGDVKPESSETFKVHLTSSDSNVQAADGTGTITNDDNPPTISLANVSHNEGDSGTTPFVFTATLSVISGQTVVVGYNTSDGTATVANNDYQATSGTLTFAPGTTTATITVLVNGDTLQEPDETFSVNLQSPAINGLIAVPSATGTIVNEATDTGADVAIESYGHRLRRRQQGFGIRRHGKGVARRQRVAFGHLGFERSGVAANADRCQRRLFVRESGPGHVPGQLHYSQRL